MRTLLLNDIVKDTNREEFTIHGEGRNTTVIFTQPSEMNSTVTIEELTIKDCNIKFSTAALNGFNISKIIFENVLFFQFIDDNNISIPTVTDVLFYNCIINYNNINLSFESFPNLNYLIINMNQIVNPDFQHNKKLEFIEINSSNIEITRKNTFPKSVKYLSINSEVIELDSGIFNNTTNSLIRLSVVATVGDEGDTIETLNTVRQDNLKYLRVTGLDVSKLSKLCGSPNIKVLDISGFEKKEIVLYIKVKY